MAAFAPKTIDNFIAGATAVPVAGQYIDVESPSDSSVIAQVAMSSTADVEAAVEAGREAFKTWSKFTVKKRASIMFRFHELVIAHADELADLVVLESGKNKAEALAEVAKGNETVEWACSIPQLSKGGYLEVSGGITCREITEPLGVVASIAPFNFPFMVPMWTIPIALTAGNVVICKPSEKVPMTLTRTAELLVEAGIPSGVFQLVNGGVDTVNAIVDHPGIPAVTFVGSSRVAQIVTRRGRALDKRMLGLGGAKNHLVALPDCNIERTSADVVSSYCGCAGQRCMAASVLLVVGPQPELIQAVVAKSAALTRGNAAGQVGAIIDAASKERILGFINEAEAGGCKILQDGRSWASEQGNWVGPTVILQNSKDDPAMHVEIFGPVVSILQVASEEEALAIENANPHGNAACVYTESGGKAEYFASRFTAGMVGVNIGVPVPREPFSFGGMFPTKSKYGDCDITGDGALRFFTRVRKITQRWATGGAAPAAPAAAAVAAVEDKADFN